MKFKYYCLSLLLCILCTDLHSQNVLPPGNEGCPKVMTYHFGVERHSIPNQVKVLQNAGMDGMMVNSDGADLDAYFQTEEVRNGTFQIYDVWTHVLVDHPESLESDYKRVESICRRIQNEKSIFQVIFIGYSTRENIARIISEVANIAARYGKDLVIYPHAGMSVATAEIALSYIKELNKPNIYLAVHLCHELAEGYGNRIEEVVKNVAPYIKSATISGATPSELADKSLPEWYWGIKPLNIGDYDLQPYFNALKANGYTHPIGIHTWGLDKNFGLYSEVHLPISKSVLMQLAFPTCNISPKNYWNFDSEMEKWGSFNQLTTSVSSGIATLSIFGNDPYMHSPNNLNISASDNKYVVVSMHNQTASNTAELFWITTSDGAYNATKRVSFSIVPNDTKLRYYIIDLSANPNWSGTIKQIRIDPTTGITSGTVLIDFIKITGAHPTTIATIPGTIEIENFNKGGQGNAYFDTDASNNGGQYRTSENVDIENCGEGGYNVGWIVAGEWMEYLVNVSKTATYDFVLRTASATDGNQFHLDVDGENVSGVKTVNTLGGLQTYFDIKNTVRLTRGKHVLKLAIDKSNGGFNLNKMVFTEATTTGLEDAESSNLILVYPNPAHNVLNVQMHNSAIGQTIYLLNATGEMVVTKMLDNDKKTIDIQNLSAGMYMLKVGRVIQKIMITK